MGKHIVIGVVTKKKYYVSKETLYSKHQSFYLPKGSPIKVSSTNKCPAYAKA